MGNDPGMLMKVIDQEYSLKYDGADRVTDTVPMFTSASSEAFITYSTQIKSANVYKK